MKINKKALTLMISTIISFNYVSIAQATDYSAPIKDGNTILNDGEKISYESNDNTTDITGVNLNDSSSSLTINGAGTISIINAGATTAISAATGSNVDLGSGSLVESKSSNSAATGVILTGADTTLTADNLKINVTATSGSTQGLSLSNINSHLTGSTEINTSTSGFARGIELLNGSSLTIDKLTLNVENGDGYGIYALNGSNLTLGDGSSIKVENHNAIYVTGSGTTLNLNKATIDAQDAYAINAQNNSIVNLGTGTTINSGNTRGVGIWVLDNSLLTADNLTVNHTGTSEAIDANFGGIIKIGANSHITSSSGGIAALANSSVYFEGSTDKRNNIVTHGKWVATAQGSGAEVNIKNTDIIADKINGGTSITGLFGYNQGTINAENTNISMNDDSGFAVYAQAGGVVNLTEKTEINAGSNSKSAIATSGTNSQINVTGQALINGNIFASGSGSLIDIDVTNSSVINGYTTVDTENPGATLDFKTTDSIWNMTGDSQITALNVNNSTINFTKTGFATLTTDYLDGSNSQFNMRTDIVAKQGDLIVVNGTAQGDYQLNITNKGSSTTDGTETLTIVKTADNQANFTLTNKVELGAYEYSLRNVENSPNDLELYSSGKKKSSSAEAAGSFLTIGYLANFVENQTLLQRLGDLRNGQIMNTKANGFWIKGFGGHLNSFSGSSFDGFEANYFGTMLGADKELDVDVGHLLVGGMVGFTRINPDYKQGSGNGKNYSASLYATYLLDNGFYLDGIIKYNNLKNRFDVKDTANQHVSGTSKTQGISLSAELGQRFWLSEANQGRYIEPQVQLTYSYQNSDTVHSSNGLNVQLGHYNSVLLRVGSLFGYQINGENPINIYVKVGMIRELDGDVCYHFNDGENNDFSFKSGWFDSGLGANINFNKQHSIYTEADFTTGHRFNNLMFNAGYRYSF